MVVFMLDDLRPKSFYSLPPPFAFLVLPPQHYLVIPRHLVIKAVFFQAVTTFFMFCHSGFLYRRKFRIDVDLIQGYKDPYVSSHLWSCQTNRITPRQLGIHKGKHLLDEVSDFLVYLNRNGLCKQSGVRVSDEFHIEILIIHH